MVTLREVMSTDLIVVPSTATVAEAAQMMSVHHVGSALVMDGEHLAGIFTERDIVRALGTDFDATGHPVATWMTRDPETMTPDTTTIEALDRMLHKGFRHLPVVDDERVLGVVSLRDLAPR